MKYRKKPVVIEAYLWTGAKSLIGAPGWLVGKINAGEAKIATVIGNCCLYIKTLEGTMEGQPGDYIIQGVNGEIYPCKPDIFAKTYEPVEADHAGK